MRTRQTFTISLPPEMAEKVEKTMKAEQRTRSELVREALRRYISFPRFLEESPPASELRAMRRGWAAYERGDFVTLDDLQSEPRRPLPRHPRRSRQKVS